MPNTLTVCQGWSLAFGKLGNPRIPAQVAAVVAFSTTSAATRLRPPVDLTGPEKSLFVDLVLACRADHFQHSDLPLLAAYARAVVAERVAAGELAAANVVEDKPSPWLAIWQSKPRAMTRLSRMLRLNPACRKSTPSSEPEASSADELDSRSTG